MSNRYLTREDIRLDGIDWNKDYPLITPSMGAGKTYFVFSGELKNVYENHSNKKIDVVIYGVPTTSIKNQVLSDYDTNAVELNEEDLFSPNLKDKRVRVCCVSKLAAILKENVVAPRVNYLIALDEFDEYARWTLCHSDKLCVWDWIESNRDKIQLCGITATPTLLTKFVRRESFKDTTPDFPIKYKSDNIRIWPNTQVDTLARGFRATENNKILIYTRSAKKCLSLSRNIPNSGFLVSTYYDKKDGQTGQPINELMAAQIVKDDVSGRDTPLLDYVIKRHRLPQGIDVLIINDAYAAGINIHDESVKRVIAESVEVDTIKQVMGRVRHDLESLDVCYNFKEKSMFLKHVDRANEFYKGNIAIEDLYNSEQAIIKEVEATNGDLPIDILTYKSNYDNQIKINPFAHGCYVYQAETYNRLTMEPQRRIVYAPLHKHGRNGIKWLKPYEISSFRERTNNVNKIDGFNIDEWIGRKLFKDDKKELVAQLKLRNGKGRVSSWPTAKKYLIELGYEVKESNTTIKGKKHRYSQIVKKDTKL